MQKSKNAFTMIELVFVIVVLGILAAIAVPKFTATRDDAKISSARAVIASVRSGIVSERQTRLITGDRLYIAGTTMDNGGLFGGVLMYSVTGSGWASAGAADANTSTYEYTLKGTTVDFTYTRGDGRFGCDTTAGTAAEQDLCKNLVN